MWGVDMVIAGAVSYIAVCTIFLLVYNQKLKRREKEDNAFFEKQRIEINDGFKKQHAKEDLSQPKTCPFCGTYRCATINVNCPLSGEL